MPLDALPHPRDPLHKIFQLIRPPDQAACQVLPSQTPHEFPPREPLTNPPTGGGGSNGGSSGCGPGGGHGGGRGGSGGGEGGGGGGEVVEVIQTTMRVTKTKTNQVTLEGHPAMS